MHENCCCYSSGGSSRMSSESYACNSNAPATVATAAAKMNKKKMGERARERPLCVQSCCRWCVMVAFAAAFSVVVYCVETILSIEFALDALQRKVDAPTIVNSFDLFYPRKCFDKRCAFSPPFRRHTHRHAKLCDALTSFSYVRCRRTFSSHSQSVNSMLNTNLLSILCWQMVCSFLPETEQTNKRSITTNTTFAYKLYLANSLSHTHMLIVIFGFGWVVYCVMQ